MNKAKSTNRAEIASSLKNNPKGEKPTVLEDASPQVNEYLKMISRFENKVKQGEIEDKDLERIMKALEDKVLSMNPQQQNRLKMLELFKKNGIENFNNMKETLIEMFENKAERETFFDFLKSPDFVTILLNEGDQLKGYKPPKASVAQNTGPVKPEKPDLQGAGPQKA